MSRTTETRVTCDRCGLHEVITSASSKSWYALEHHGHDGIGRPWQGDLCDSCYSKFADWMMKSAGASQ